MEYLTKRPRHLRRPLLSYLSLLVFVINLIDCKVEGKCFVVEFISNVLPVYDEWILSSSFFSAGDLEESDHYFLFLIFYI